MCGSPFARVALFSIERLVFRGSNGFSFESGGASDSRGRWNTRCRARPRWRNSMNQENGGRSCAADHCCAPMRHDAFRHYSLCGRGTAAFRRRKGVPTGAGQLRVIANSYSAVRSPETTKIVRAGGTLCGPEYGRSVSARYNPDTEEYEIVYDAAFNTELPLGAGISSSSTSHLVIRRWNLPQPLGSAGRVNCFYFASF